MCDKNLSCLLTTAIFKGEQKVLLAKEDPVDTTWLLVNGVFSFVFNQTSERLMKNIF